MGTEVELKLAVTPHALRAATRLSWLRQFASGPPIRQKLVSVYFDTPKFGLQERGLSLRIRSMGRKRVQTIKTKANGSSGAFGRGEWEEDIEAETPDLKRAKGTALEPLVSRKLEKLLKPVFETEVHRLIFPLRMGDSELELAFDRGQIRTGPRREEISEIELELKKGDRADLARLSERLAKSITVAYDARQKSERGYALCSGQQHSPVAASAIVLRQKASAGEAFAVIGLSCLNHLAANEQAVRKGDFEGVHQMRVGLRRLRAAIAIFDEIVDGAVSNEIKRDLKWLTEQLGAARDFDVFVKEGVAPLRENNPEQPEIVMLERDISKKREAGLENAKAAVTGERYRTTILRVAIWLINGDWLRNADPRISSRRGQPVTALAQDALDRRTKKIAKKIRKLKNLDATHRHKLRIAVKKLRYGADFFASLFPKSKARKARKRFEKVLKTLQDALGKLNDISVHAKLANEFTNATSDFRKSSQKAFAMGLLAARETQETRACLAKAVSAGKDLGRAKSFWC